MYILRYMSNHFKIRALRGLFKDLGHVFRLLIMSLLMLVICNSASSVFRGNIMWNHAGRLVLLPHTQALSSLAGHWKMSVLSRNPHRLLLILIVCFSFNFPFFATKPAALPTRKRGSKVFDSNSRQTLRGTSSARQPLMFHAEPDREEREKLLKLYLKRSITFSVMTLTV